MLEFRSAVSPHVNSLKAIRQALVTATGDSTSSTRLVIMHSTMGHNLPQLVEGAQELCPDAEIVGCTGSGAIGCGWVSEAVRSLAIMTITGDEIAAAVVEGTTGANSRDVATRCAQDLKERLPSVNMVMALAPGLNVDGDAIIEGIESVFGTRVPILGALSGTGASVPRTPLFHGGSIHEDAMVFVGLGDPGLELIQGAHHGNLPHDEYRFTVTKAHGTRVDELDGRPAWPVLMDSLGLPHTTQPVETICLLGLGIDLDESDKAEYDNAQLLRAPLHLSEDAASFYMQASVEEGQVLVSCQRNEDHIFAGVDRLTKRLKEQMGGRRPVAVFQTDCMARGRMSADVVTKDEITSLIQSPLVDNGEVPWLGVYGFAEFCMLNGRNCFHNYTTALSVLVRRR